MGQIVQSFLPSAARRPRARARLALALGVLAAALAAAPAPAGAVETAVNGVPFGISPAATGFSSAASESPISYGGGPVVHNNALYAIYWDPHNSYPVLGQRLVNVFLRNLTAEAGELSNVFAVSTQYGDAAGKVTGNSDFRGAYTDVAPFPSSGNCTDAGSPCVTDAQIRAQLTEYISANGLPTGVNPAVGATPIYLIFLPPAVTVCAQGSGEGGNCSDEHAAQRLCSYHSYIGENPSRGLGTILYATVPWTPVTACQNGGTFEEPSLQYKPEESPADVIANQAVGEDLSVVTDPLLNAWHDTGADTDEVTDKCRDEFNPLVPGAPAGELYNQVIGGRPYYLNDVFNQAGLYNSYTPGECVNAAALEPYFTTQTSIKANNPVTFDATESVASLGIAAYRWSFGDGSHTEVNCGTQTPTYGYSPSECSGTSGVSPVASVVHTYRYGGSYEVSLTITDDGGHVSTSGQEVTVLGPAAPPGSAGRSSAGSTTQVFPDPIAGATILSRSLKLVIQKGLAVRYTVNERVAGFLQVLISRSLAERLGITGAVAKGLPSGTPASKIVATALLVTSRGGQSTIRIRLSSHTGARLARLGRIAVSLRLIVHNASTNPVSTTVMRSATLVK